jgi:hypothetical protein
VITSVIPATWQVEIGKIRVPDQPGQKVYETPSQWKKSGHGGNKVKIEES